MTLTELRYIVTLAQEQRWPCRRALPRQSADLSVGVKKLEDELGY